MSLISFSIPVYNNEGSLKALYNDISFLMGREFPNDKFEIVLVNDGSKDNSLAIINELHYSDPRVKLIDLSRNFGQMAAILAGWQHAKGDAVINMSADLQDPVLQAIKMIKEWKSGSEVVISYRDARSDAWTKNLTSFLFYTLIKYSLPQVPKGGFDFTLLDRKALDAINSLKERNRFYQADVLWVGFTLKFLPYERLKRQHGKSQYNFTKRFGNFITGFINISYLPIRVMTLIGSIFSLLSFLYALNIVYAYFVHKTPFTGWAPLMIIILLLGGLIMMMLGVIGEYVWRIYDEAKNKPYYIIKEKKGDL